MDLQEFTQLYSSTTNSELAVRYGLTVHTIKYHAGKLGLKKSPEHVSQLRRSEHTGKPRTEETKQKIATKLRGRVIGPEPAKKALETKKQRGTLIKGPQHNWWTGGMNTAARFADPRYRDWRNAVMERDGWKCRECGKLGNRKRGTGLDAHHRKAWGTHPDLRYDVDNGVALCRPCHTKEHSRRWAKKGYWV